MNQVKRTARRAFVASSDCVACGCCVKVCPKSAIQIARGVTAVVDLEKCVGCGRCYVSCYDGAHQAIDWDAEKRRPVLNEECVGCHLCLNVCPVADCITPGELVWKEGRAHSDVKLKKNYE